MARITVLMPAYNAMPYLPEAVDSILSQTFRDFTFLIINDGSTDETRAYLDSVKDPRIKAIHQHNRGAGSAKNYGLSICDTEYVAIMDADDVSLPTRLEAQIRFLQNHSDIGLVGTQVTYLGVGGRTGISPSLPYDHETIYNGLIDNRAAVFPATIMCRTSMLKRTGGYKVEQAMDDMDMLLRMGEITKLANLKERLYLLRIHSSSIMATRLAEAWTQYAHARDSAIRRAEGRPEITFDEFVIEQRKRPFVQKTLDAMELYAFGQYRLAVAEILSPRRIVGYPRLAWAALCSPQRAIQRINRTIQNRKKS